MASFAKIGFQLGNSTIASVQTQDN